MIRRVVVLAAAIAATLLVGGSVAWGFLFDDVEQPAVFSLAGPADLIGLSTQQVDLGEVPQDARRVVPSAFAVTGGATLTGPVTYELRADDAAAVPAFDVDRPAATTQLGVGDEERVDLALDVSGLPAGPHETRIVVEALLPGGARVHRTVTVELVVVADDDPKPAPAPASDAPRAPMPDAPAPGTDTKGLEPEPVDPAPEPDAPAPAMSERAMPEPAPAAPLDPQLADA